VVLLVLLVLLLVLVLMLIVVVISMLTSPIHFHREKLAPRRGIPCRLGPAAP